MGQRNRDISQSLAHIILRTSLALAVVGLVLVGAAGLAPSTALAAYAGNSTINFQGRLLTNTGAVVADGTYNVEFKIYTGGDGKLAGDIIDGANPAGTLEWTEDWVYGPGSGAGWVDNRVIVKNGYFSVNLGSICPLEATSCTANMGNSQTNGVVNFNSTPLWLSMNVSTSTGTLATFSSGDGEMLPMNSMGSAPFAQNSAELGGLTSAGFLQTAPATTTVNTVTSSGTTTALTVNNSSTVVGVALNQSGVADSEDIVVSATGTTSNGLVVSRTTTGTTANALSVTDGTAGTTANGLAVTASTGGTVTTGISLQQTGTGTFGTGIATGGTMTTAISIAGTATTGISFSGTDTTDISKTSGTLTMQGTGGISLVAGTTNSVTVDSAGAGSVLLGDAQATTIKIGSSAPTAARTTTIAGGNSGFVDTVNIGTGATTVAGGKTINIGNGTPTGSGTNLISIGSLTNASTTTIQGGTGAAITISAASGGTLAIGSSGVANTINVGNTGAAAAVAQTINLGTNSTAGATNTITIGNTAATASTLSMQGGTGATAISMQAGAAGTILIGTTNINAVTIGSATQDSSHNITIGQSAATNTINVGNSVGNAATQTIAIGTSATSGSITTATIGSTTTGSTTTLHGGSTTASVAGSGLAVQTTTNSTSAFQIQNALGSTLLNADTTNSITDVTNGQVNNEITNGSMEVNTTGWATLGAGVTLTSDPSQSYIGNHSLNITTSATATTGAKFPLTTSTLVANTKYTFTVNARSFNNGGDMTTFAMGYFDGTNTVSCLTAQTVHWYGWTTLSCTFTPTVSSGTPYIWVDQTDATARTFYIDGVELQRYSILSNASMEQTFTASDWVTTGVGTTTLTQNATHEDGSESMQVATTVGAIGSGVKHNITLDDATTYSLYMYMNTAGASIGNVYDVGYNNGTTSTPCMTKQPITTGQWSYYVCTITTPSSHSGTPYFYISSEDAVAHTFLVDAVQLNYGQQISNYQEGQISLNGTIDSPIVAQNRDNSTSALQIQNALGVSDFNVDTENNTVSMLGHAIVAYDIPSGTTSFLFGDNITAPNQSIRFRTNQYGENIEGGGNNLYLSVWPTGAMTSDQAIVMEGGSADGNLQVGNGAGTGNDITGTPGATLLKLDKTGTAPTEADGGMYYNTNDNTFECGDNGSWTSCGNGLIESMTADSSPGLTTASYANFSGASWTPPAGDCQAGVSYLITADGFSNSGTAALAIAMDFALYQNGTDIEDMHNESTLTTVVDSSYHSWAWNMTITCQSLNSAMIQGFATSDGNRGTGMDSPAGNARTGVVALTSGGTFQLEGRWRTAPTGSGFAIVMTNLVVQRLAP